MQDFNVLEACDGWHVCLPTERLEVIFPTREEAIAFTHACVPDGASGARSEIEQGDVPLPPLIGTAKYA